MPPQGLIKGFPETRFRTSRCGHGRQHALARLTIQISAACSRMEPSVKVPVLSGAQHVHTPGIFDRRQALGDDVLFGPMRFAPCEVHTDDGRQQLVA